MHVEVDESLSQLLLKKGTQKSFVHLLHKINEAVDLLLKQEYNDWLKQNFIVENNDQFCALLRKIAFCGCSEIRASLFRLLRYMLNADLIEHMIKYNYDFIIARALLMNYSERESFEAIRLIMKWSDQSSSPLPLSILTTVITMVNAMGQDVSDDLCVACLKILCKIAIKQTAFALEQKVIDTLIDVQYNKYRLNFNIDAIVLSILAGFERMQLGRYPHYNFVAKIIAPVLEAIYTSKGDVQPLLRREHIERLCTCAVKLCFNCWSGRFYMHYEEQSILSTLCAILISGDEKKEQFSLRILYEILGYDYPTGCQTLHQIFRKQDKQNKRLFNDSLFRQWPDHYGFVASECYRYIVPCSRKRAEFSMCDRSYLLLMFLDSGFVDACIHLIIKGRDLIFMAVNYILAEFLYSCVQLLPHHLNFIPLPKLISMESKEISLYMNTLLSRRSVQARKREKNSSSERRVLIAQMRTSDDTFDQFSVLFDRTNVNHPDPLKWKWKKLHDMLSIYCHGNNKARSSQFEFFSRMLQFFSCDSSHLFTNTSIDDPMASTYARCSLLLIDIFTTSEHRIYRDRIFKFAKEIECELKKALVAWKNGASDFSRESIVFSRTTVEACCSQYYFLMIGQLSTTEFGRSCIQGIYDLILEMVSIPEALPLLILSISCFEYGFEEEKEKSERNRSRQLFEACINSPEANLRLYCTAMLRFFLRTKTAHFKTWCLPILLQMLYDLDCTVSQTALDIFDEACEMNEFCDALLTRTSVGRLMSNVRTKLCMARLFSNETLFQQFKSRGILQRVLAEWEDNMNNVYAALMDEKISLLKTWKNMSPNATCNSLKNACMICEKYHNKLLPHLYGELCKHQFGCALIKENQSFINALNGLKRFESNEQDECTVKQNLWLIGNIASASKHGSKMIIEANVIPHVLHIIQNSFSITTRIVAYYTANLISTFYEGGNELKKYSWSFCTRKYDVLAPVHLDFLRDINIGFYNSNNKHDSVSYGEQFFIWLNVCVHKREIRSSTADSGFESSSNLSVNKLALLKKRNGNCGILKNDSLVELKQAKDAALARTNTLADIPYKLCALKTCTTLQKSEQALRSLNHSAQYNEFRQVTGLFSFNVFSFWIESDESDDDDDDSDANLSETISKHSTNLKSDTEDDFLFGICVPDNYRILIEQSFNPTLFAKRIQNKASVHNVEKHSNQDSNLPATNDEKRYLLRLVHLLLTGVQRKHFEDLLIKCKYEKPHLFMDFDIFIDVCALISLVRKNRKQKETLYELFSHLKYSEE